MSNQIPVVIAGAGVTGLSAALHLAEAGVQKILIVTGSSIPTSLTAPGMLSGGQRDNFTRVAAAHQSDFAKTIWLFGDRAFDLTAKAPATHAVAADPAPETVDAKPLPANSPDAIAPHESH